MKTYPIEDFPESLRECPVLFANKHAGYMSNGFWIGTMEWDPMIRSWRATKGFGPPPTHWARLPSLKEL